MATTVLAWAAFAFVLAPFSAVFFGTAQASSSADLLGGVGIPVIFIILVFVFANSQSAIDRVFRVSDAD